MAGLTDVSIRKSKAAEKAYKLTDSGGLYLNVAPTGSKVWRLRYRMDGKEQTLTIGSYPDVSLSDARIARDEAKAVIRSGRDPGTVKKIEKLVGRQRQGETFEAIAREWHAIQLPIWSEKHAADVLGSLETDVFPTLGHLPIREINEPLVLAVVRLVEQRGAKETARRLRQRISSVFVYGISAGKASSDPAAILTKAMAPMSKGKFPAITEINAVRQMLRDVEACPGHPVTKLAIRFLALTAARPGPLSTTPWREIDAIDPKDNIWTIPAARMKLKKKHKDDPDRDHFIPLSTQALEVLEVLRELTGRGKYVFPNLRGSHKPMSENAMGYMLHRAGYHGRHVPHGFRTSFSTHMNEKFPADRAIIDFMLAHVPKDQIEAAYNRALYLRRRQELAQLWADILMEGAPSADELLHGPRKILNPVDYRGREHRKTAT